MTPTNKCQHDGETITGWDEVTCKKCGWIVPSGQRIGIHDGWFPSHDAHKEFKKYRTYTGMDNTYPIDTTKSAEVQNMTQNNEREAFEALMSIVLRGGDTYNYLEKYSTPNFFGQYVNGDVQTAWVKYQEISSLQISQNEQQDVVAWVVKIPESRRGCSNDIVFYYKMSEMLKEHILAGDDVTPLYASPPKQIPDGWKLIGKVSEMGVVWHKQNPHAHPVGTEFYAVLPTTSLTSETNTEVGE